MIVRALTLFGMAMVLWLNFALHVSWQSDGGPGPVFVSLALLFLAALNVFEDEI